MAACARFEQALLSMPTALAAQCCDVHFPAGDARKSASELEKGWAPLVRQATLDARSDDCSALVLTAVATALPELRKVFDAVLATCTGRVCLLRDPAPWLRSNQRNKFRLSVSFHVVGIGHLETAMLEGCWPHDTVNVFDIRQCVLPALESIHGSGGARTRDFYDMQPADWDDSE